ncbi:MAG: HYR domain-containing protein [Prolixibacteraceae bacterium]|jgi:hypothetical protein|nr:HYR domain-containing protein [Prolixibacteraceae bacterium]
MKKLIIHFRMHFCILAIIGSFAFLQSANAQLANYGFETGNFIGWSASSGTTISSGTSYNQWTVNPADSYMARIDPNSGLYRAAVETALGLQSGSLVASNASLFNSTTNFATLKQQFVLLAANQIVSIYWNFIARDYAPFNDGAIATLVGPSYKQIKLLAVTANAYGDAGAIVTGSYGSAGWHKVSFTSGTAGIYTLGFASFNTGDQILSPILIIDNAPGGNFQPGQPIILTTAVSSVGTNSAVSGGNVTSDGGATVTARGVCWNTTGSPTVTDAHTNNGTGLGSFTSNVTGLLQGATYYLRAYAINSAGTVYGGQIAFTTINPIPANPTSISASANPICNGTSTQLTANGALGTVYWYTGSCGGTFVGTGNTINVSPGVTTTYFARNYSNGLYSNGCASTTITVNSIPTITGTTPASRCGTGTVSLGASASAGTINWYSASSGGPSLGTGTSFTTPGISTTTTYWVDANANGCTTASRTAVTATVNAIPVINCPSNITVNNTPGQCGANVNFPAATATGTPTPTITYSQASGSFFPVGTTTVTATATNSCGNTSCTFTVTVADIQAPVITCPGNIAKNNDPGQCGANVTFVATATDNCSASISYSHQPGSFFPTGSTTVTVTAKDPSNNTSTCSFVVTVNDTELPNISCPFNITVNTAPNVCGAVVNYETPSATDNCGGGALPTSLPGYTYKGTHEGHSYFLSNTQVTPEVAHANAIATGGHLATANDLGENQFIAGFIAQRIWIGFTDRDVEGTWKWITSEPVNYTHWAPGEPNNAGNEDWAVINWSGTNPDWNDLPLTSVAYYAVEFDGGTLPAQLVSGLPSGSTFPVGVNTVTHRVVDPSGNAVECSFTVTVVDNQAPTVLTKNISVQLDNAGTASITADQINNGSSDNCTIASKVVSPSTFNCSNVGTNNVILTVTDVNGKVSTGTAVVTVQDVTKPTITDVADKTVNCQDDNTSVATGVATGTDNCGPVTITQSETSTKGTDPLLASFYNYVITRTWKATDVTGNFSTSVQVITVQDVTKPIITDVADVTVNCQDDNTSVATGVAIGTDNCSPVTITQSDVSTQNADPAVAGHYNYTITRTWRATDVTGNFSESVQVITVHDVTKPIITDVADVTVNCQDDNTSVATGVATGTDNCSPVTITQSDVSTQNADPGVKGHYNYTITRTWRATDVTGNFSESVQVITVQDVTNPTITDVADVTKNCQNDNTSVATGVATGTDNCGPVTITQSETSTKGTDPLLASFYNYVITRTWKATDLSGNFSTSVQVITVQDVTNPIITDVADKTVNCQDDNTSVATGVATGTDNCSPVTITQSDVSTQNADPGVTGHYNYTITRTWRATDVTGNFSESVQVITVQDVTKPIITDVADKTVNCQDDNTSVATGVATGTDNCSPVTITQSDVSTQNADPAVAGHYNYTITRTWRATDVTGNFSESVQVITVQDVTKPIITDVADKTVNCQDDNTSVATGVATGTDNCSPVTITQSDVSTQNADPGVTGHYNYTITRTWRATDVTGNFSESVQVITVQDVTKPIITDVADKTVNCQDDNTSVATGVATGTDNCSPVTITQSDVSTQNADPAVAGHYNYTITRTWRATDVTGNFSESVQVITVHDVTKPIITDVADKTVNCQDDNTSVATGVATGTDNCSPVTITQSDVSTQNADPAVAGRYNYTITRTWRATDVTGNFSESVQVITVHDVTKPIITDVADVTVNCQDNNTSVATGVATGTDNCSPVTITQSDVSTQNADPGVTGHYNYTITRTWRATDVTGNFSESVQVITVQDVTNPIVTDVTDVTVNCQDDNTSVATGVATGTDNCSPVTITQSDVSTQNADPGVTGHYNYTITRTWRATDVTGNFSESVQVITVQDVTSPTPICQSITIYLDADGNASILPSQINNGSYDNCSPVILVSVVPNSFDCENVGTNSVLLTVRDVTGNTSTCQATVTVQDKVVPVITCKTSTSKYIDPYQTYYTVVDTEFDATATDACGVKFLTYLYNGIVSSNFPTLAGTHLNVGTHTFVWTAIDVNGNESACTTVVTVLKRPTTLTYNGDVNEQYSDQTDLSATLIDNVSGLGVSGKTITFTIGSQSTTAVTNASGVAIANLVITQAPGTYNVLSAFAGDGSYLASSDSDPFPITQEDARVNFTGTQLVATQSSTSGLATVTLRATVQDITAVTGDPVYDAFAGDIRNSRVRFVKDGVVLTDWLTPTLVNNTDLKVGVVSYNWSVNIGTATDEEYTIGIEVGSPGYYLRYDQSDNTIVTVYKPVGDFITGGGYILPTSSAGSYAADPSLKTNFGFNVGYNKSGKNIHGNMNIIFRRTVGGIVHTYQIKANAMTSLGVNIANPAEQKAVFVSKANLKDITNPLAPVSLGGNLTLQVNLTDRGEPGSSDQIAISLYDGSTLMYSSNWSGAQTSELLLSGGNLVVHSGFSLGQATVTTNKSAKIEPVIESETKDPYLKVYPNPFNDRVRFEFVSPEDVNAQIDIYDVKGRLVETIFKSPVESNVLNNAEFKSQSDIRVMYMYRVTLGSKIYTGKVLYGNN